MEGDTGTGPQFDYERAKRVLGERGVRADCPLCGADDWRQLGEMRNLLSFLDAVTPYGELVEDHNITEGITCYHFACGKCGFVRLHATPLVDPEPGSEAG